MRTGRLPRRCKPYDEGLSGKFFEATSSDDPDNEHGVQNPRGTSFETHLPGVKEIIVTTPHTNVSVPQISDGVTNRLLAALSNEVYERLTPHLTTVALGFKEVLQQQGEPIHHVYFPGGGALSLIKQMQDGRVAEVATIGHEGLAGANVFFGETESTGEVIVQVPDGHGYRLSVDVRYYQAFVNQIMQTTVCNALHTAEERGCRWVLMTHDRVGRDEFRLTQEFAAAMLGVRRPTMTLVAGNLQRAGLIKYRHGYITIVDRIGLEAASCECYERVRATFRRLLPESMDPAE
jgi:CRP-like cAMP-binding protein